MFLNRQYFWLTKYTKMHRYHQIALRFPTFSPRIHYQGFTDHCKLVLKNCETKPLLRLHKNNLQDSFLHESVKKLGFSLVVSDFEIFSSICSLKYKNDSSDTTKHYPDFKIFPGEACPRIPLARLHGMISKIYFCMSLWKKLGRVNSCNIRICLKILWIIQFYLLTKNTKRRIR